MAVSFVINMGLKEMGGITFTPWVRPVELIRGQWAKVGLVYADPSGRPVTITAFTLKLRFPQAGGGFVEKTGIAIDNVKGEVEFILTPADTSLFVLADKQNVDLEVHLTATPTITSIHTIKAVLNVSAPSVA